MSKASKARSRLAVRYFDDRILLTDGAAWAYFRLPTVSYEFTTGEEREALATNITIALAGVRMQDAEIHLRIAHRTYPAADWALALDRTSDGGPGWREYLEEMYAHVWAKDFWTKEVYLGVRLGPRGVGAQLSGGRSGSSSACTSAARRRSACMTTRSRRRRSRVDGAGGAAGPCAAWQCAVRAARSSTEVAWLFQRAASGGVTGSAAVGDPAPHVGRG